MRQLPCRLPVGCNSCSGIGGSKGNLPPHGGADFDQVVRLDAVLERGSRSVYPGSEPTTQSGTNPPAPGTRNSSSSRTTSSWAWASRLANYANVVQASATCTNPMPEPRRAQDHHFDGWRASKDRPARAVKTCPLTWSISCTAPQRGAASATHPVAEHLRSIKSLKCASLLFRKDPASEINAVLHPSLLGDRSAGSTHGSCPICHTLRANVNLIRYNERCSLLYKRPRAGCAHVPVDPPPQRHHAHVRKSRGRDITLPAAVRRKELQSCETMVQGGGALNDASARGRGFPISRVHVLCRIVIILLTYFIPYLPKSARPPARAGRSAQPTCIRTGDG
jgi:hypothetical protein